MKHEIINMFWHGSISNYERASINSFLSHGHPVHVYSYHDLSLPEGSSLKDASQILAKPIADQYLRQENPHLSTLANVFRYKLLETIGGIWMDLDFICLKPIVLPQGNWVCRQDQNQVNNAAMKLQQNHPLAKELYLQAIAMGPNPPRTRCGPKLLSKLILDYSDVSILDSSYFYPIYWERAFEYIAPQGLAESIPEVTFAAHWWGEILNQIGIPKSLLPPQKSWLRQFFNENTNAGECDSIAVNKWIENYQKARTFNQVKNKIKWNIKNNSGFFSLLRDLGEILADHDYLEESALLLKKSLSIYPDGIRPKILLTKVYLAQGKISEAETLLGELNKCQLNSEQEQLSRSLKSALALGQKY